MAKKKTVDEQAGLPRNSDNPFIKSLLGDLAALDTAGVNAPVTEMLPVVDDTSPEADKIQKSIEQQPIGRRPNESAKRTQPQSPKGEVEQDVERNTRTDTPQVNFLNTVLGSAPVVQPDVEDFVPPTLHVGSEIARVTSKGMSIQAAAALREALVIVCDEEGLREQIKREMRITPIYSSEDPTDALDTARSRANGRVCVVIPAYNYAAFVSEAITSVLNQTRKPDQIIVVDDASTDNTPEVVMPFVEAGLVQYVRHTKNSGAAGGPRNTGVNMTDAEFILTLDADDMIEPPYIETCLRAIQGKHNVGVVYVGVQVHEQSSGNRVIHKDWPIPFNWEWMSKRKRPPNNCIPTASLFRREMWERIGGWDEAIKSAEDVEFWIRGLGVGFDAVKCSPEPYFIYRRHGESMSSRPTDDIGLWNPNFNNMPPIAAPTNKLPILRDVSAPLVSVVIPVALHHVKYLKTCLQSVLAQSFSNWEVIIANDSRQELNLSLWPFARVIDSNGMGVSVARNSAVAEAKGDLVFFLDADDLIMPETLQRMINAYARGDAGYVYSGWQAIDTSGARTIYGVKQWNRLEALNPKGGGQHGVSVLIAREDVIRTGGFDMEALFYEDMEFFARLAAFGVNGVPIPESLLLYRVDTGIRRNASHHNRELFESLMIDRYSDYYKGVTAMCRPCGGNKNAVERSRAAAMQLTEVTSPLDVDPSGKVLMIYTGPHKAASTWLNKYRAFQGMTPIPVEPTDVKTLEGFGVWAKFSAVANAGPASTLLPFAGA